MKSFLRTIFFLIAITGCGKTSELPDLNRANWLVIGPFGNPQTEESTTGCAGFDYDFLKTSGGETGVRPYPYTIVTDSSPFDRSGNRFITRQWKNAVLIRNSMNFLPFFTNNQNSVCYAYCEFFSSAEREAVLKLGSDDGIKVWLNGKQVLEHHIHRQSIPDDDILEVKLLEGKNKLLLKIDQGNGEWGFYAKLESLEHELNVWKGAQNHFYTIITSPSGKNSFTGIVTAKPGYKPDEAVTLDIRAVSGKETNIRLSAFTGKPFSFTLPDQNGIYSIQASGKEGILASDVILKGDLKTAKKQALEAALSGQKTAPKDSFPDGASTFGYFADQLSGKNSPSLSTLERNIRTIAGVVQMEGILKKGPEKNKYFTGLHEWAYPSSIDGSFQPYTLYVPESYNPAKKYGLIIQLHGYSGDGYGDVKSVAVSRPGDFIIAAPFARGSLAYQAMSEQEVLDLLKMLTNNLAVDPDRVYVMGFSMGGYGTWRFAQYRTDLFAAAAPFCGWSGVNHLENLGNLPLFVFHGDADPTVLVDYDRQAVGELQKMNYPVHYDELPGVNHDAWNGWVRKTGDPSMIFKIFRKYKRNNWPDKIDIIAANLRYGKSYWARLIELENPFSFGKLLAEVRNSGQLKVSTLNISAFQLDLEHPKLKKGALTVVIDGEAVAAPSGSTNALFLKTDEGWEYNPEESRCVSFHTGGGIADLFYGPVTVVYGTRIKSETEKLKKAAGRLADWSLPVDMGFAGQIGVLPVRADTEITEAEKKTRNLILMGGPDENLLTAQLIGKLPVRFKGHSFELKGKAFDNAMLNMTAPNPWNPKMLASFYYLPVESEFASGFMRSLQLFFYDSGFKTDNPSACAFPDAAVIENLSGRRLGIGYFDRNWEHLVMQY